MSADRLKPEKGNGAYVEVEVRDYNDELLFHARVSLRGEQEIQLEFDGRTSTYRAADVPPGAYLLAAECEGLRGEEREIQVQPGGNREVMILGKEGMPFYYRGKVKVPFEPHPDLIAVTLRAQAGERDEEEMESQCRKLGLEPQLVADEVVRDNARLFRLPADAGDERKARILSELLELPSIQLAGPVVSLRERSLSYMTNELVVCFKPHVGEAAARALAAQFELEVVRSVPYSPNTYHLRSPEPGSYELLDVAAALAESDDVDWAEPNLVTTAELDAVNPTDYLWPGVWDRQLVGTPGAWQRLQDAGHPALGEPVVIIALVDQGIQSAGGVPAHREFQGTVSDGSAKVYRLYDFRNLVANNDAPLGDHGMGVAGVAAASADNTSPVAGQTEGLAGSAPNCRVMGLIFPSTESDIIDMYIWAAGFDPSSPRPGFPAPISPGADVFSTSIGFGAGAPISGQAAAMLDFLTLNGRGGKGCLCFFSAGNGNNNFTTYRPWAAYSKTWGMAASTLANDGVTEVRAPYSGFGPAELCAPSHDQYPILHDPPNRYGTWSCDLVGTGNLVGHAASQTVLAAAAAAGDTVLNVASVAGFAAGDRLLIDAPGVVGSEPSQVTGPPIAATNQLPVSPLINPHTVGTGVATGANDYRNNFGGTSSATPLAAGVAALVLSANPHLCWTDVRGILRETAVKIDIANTNPVGQWIDTDGDGNVDRSQWYGYGRINAEQAVGAALSEPRHCYAPVFAASGSFLVCLVRAIVYSLLIALLAIPSLFSQRIRCYIKRLVFRITHCGSGNTENCRKL